MAQPYAEQELIKPNFVQRLFKAPVRRNALIELNNLLARAGSVRDVSLGAVEDVLARYKSKMDDIPEADRAEFYRQLDTHAQSDSVISPDEKADLDHIRGLLSVSDAAARELHIGLVGPKFQSRADSEITGGELTDNAWADLLKVAGDLALTEEEAKRLYKERAGARLNEYLKMVLADQRVSPDEDKALSELATGLGVNLVYEDGDRATMDKFRLYWQIEHGPLLVISAPFALQRGEECYFTTQASWLEYRTVTKRIRYSGPTLRLKIVKGVYWRAGDLGVERVSSEVMTHIDSGQLCLTNKRMVFLGGRRNMTIALSRILNFEGFRNGVQVEKPTGRSPFLEFSDRVDVFCMLLGRLLRGESE